MIKVLVKLYSWENAKLYASDFELKKGDKVIVKTDSSNELGIVESSDLNIKEDPAEKIVRVAIDRDKEVFEEYEKLKPEYLKKSREMAKKMGLEMKIIDVRITLDGKQAVFVFTADGRVDFRELVKELSKVLKRAIRMQQIGSRDEARQLGGFGVCGRNLCCVKFSGSIPSITTDMARIQQISHRGTERISGLCGRLMCCLAYEAQQYREMLAGMPELYSVVETPEGKGTAIEINAVTQEVKVKLENGKYITVKKEDIK